MAVINGFIKVEWDFHLSLTRVFAFKQDVSTGLHKLTANLVNSEAYLCITFLQWSKVFGSFYRGKY